MGRLLALSGLFVLFVVVIAMGGCVSPATLPSDVASPESTKPTVQFPPTKGVIEYALLSKPEQPGIILGPPIVVIGKISAGSNIDTWVEDGFVPFRSNTISYKKGDAMSLIIVNGNKREVAYRLEYQDAPEVINYSTTVGNKIGYQRAPLEARNWVMFPSSVLVSDGYAVKIPIAITIPEKASMPKHWEFRIIATMKVSSTQEIAAGTRFLLSKL